MSSELIISVSGLRGIVGETLTAEVAAHYALAYESTLDFGPILITRDGRASGGMLGDAIAAVLAARGREVVDAGVAATPTTGVLVKHQRCVGGIQISASHNPIEWNGLKLFGVDGRVISATSGEVVMERFAAADPQPLPGDASHAMNIRRLEETIEDHWHLIEGIVDAPRIRAAKFKVLLDSNHGAGGLLGRRLLKELGCQLEIFGGTPDGRFAHTPEPTAENLAEIAPQVAQRGAVIGFCQDPDADRLAVIDEAGRYLGEEYTLAMCVDHVLRQKVGPVVTNCSTSRMSQDLAEKYGAAFYRSKVGEANVTDMMIEHGAIIGGEGNGGTIDPRVVYVRDSFVGMALLLDAMAARQKTISELAGELPRYAMVKTKVALAKEKLPAALAALEKHFADAETDALDGLRFDWPGRWLLVRASNTEPIVRIMAEAADAKAAETMCDDAGGVIARV
ncbi:MAG: phosphoglucosamine mutase [Planctomycetota bacterium]|nr:MAG: phosphoglucosamine mutase [Planctomycetota bacterium]REK40943.1 MAG: phosphoglucosamine mutase [Planctomycetota bacterium]